VNDISLQLLIDLSVVSDGDGPDLKSLYANAAETLGLSTVDYLTIRDLVRLSGSGDISLHLLLIAMFVSLYEGSVCLRLDARSLKKKLEPVAGTATDRRVKDILGGLGRYPDLIHSINADSPFLFENPRDAYKPLILIERGGERYLYFQKYYSAERTAADSLAALCARPSLARSDHQKTASALASVLREKPVLVNGAPAVLNHEQTLAVLLPVMNNFVIISGGPGTGKTFIVLTLIRVMARMGTSPQRIRIAAPTGRAAQRLTDSIRSGLASITGPGAPDDNLAALQGTTIHRLLGYSPKRNDFSYNRYNPIPADLVIVDEASMIDIVLLGKLFQALDGGACLVMLGDRDQLPSVEAGAVLAGLIPEGTDALFSTTASKAIQSIMPDIKIPAAPPAAGKNRDSTGGVMQDRVIILKNSYRSEESIKAAARKIIAQDQSVIDDIPELDLRGGYPEQGVWRIEPEKSGMSYSADLHHALRIWASRQYETAGPDGTTLKELLGGISGREPAARDDEVSGELRKVMSFLDSGRILTPVRSGIAGASGINDYLHASLIATFDPAGAGKTFSGAPIIISQNDYDRGLYNGDVGLVIMSGDGRYYGVFERFEGIRLYPVEMLPPHDLSYAITVHKSQGSEYGSVFLVLPGSITGSLLTTEILYTGLTRAKNCAVIYASRSTLSRAIANRTDRESGTGLYKKGL
jgi:exodeoxyribonuclease V alpha subunit